MRNKLLFLLLSILVVLLHGCAAAPRQEGVETSTQERSLEPFHAVAISGNFDVDITVQAQRQVRLIAPKKYLNDIKTFVDNGVLYVQWRSNFHPMRQPLVVDIGAPVIDAITVKGAANVNASNLENQTLQLSLEGAGTLNAQGSGESLELRLAGSGTLNATDLPVKRAQIALSGAGVVNVNASEELDVQLNGAGTVNYFGAPPKVNKQVRGKGDVNDLSRDW